MKRKSLPPLSSSDTEGLTVGQFHEAIKREDVSHFEALFNQPQTAFYSMLDHSALWDHIFQHTLCGRRWNRRLEEMALLLLKHGYAVNFLGDHALRVTFNRAWRLVSTETSSPYLLRCYGDLGSSMINPDWHPLSRLQRRGADFDQTEYCKQLDDKREEKLALLRSVWNNWCPEEHKDFPLSFRSAVFTFLLIRQHDILIYYCILKGVAHRIFVLLARIWCNRPPAC